MNAPTATEERALNALRDLTPRERRTLARDLDRLIESDGSTITEATTWGEMHVDDVFPDGKRIITWSSRPAESNPAREVVTVEFEYGANFLGHPHRSRYTDNWADETWGESVARSRFMGALVDHS